jgi:ribose/xylose/arabinose/galactoside ABC-type transport system permease subunit
VSVLRRLGRGLAGSGSGRRLAPLVTLVLTWAVFSALAPDTFMRWTIAATMVRQTAVVALGAIGATAVIVSGGIDLSVGSSVAFTTVVVACLLRAGHGPLASCLAGVLAATACGTACGVLVARARIAPFIVTLGAMSLLRGAAKGLADEQKIDCDPRGIDTLLGPSSGWPLVPPGVWLVFALALLGAFVLRYTRFGRHLYAVGSNEATALVCGVDVPRIKIAVYAVAGAFAGLAGVLEFSTLTVGDPTDSVGLELEVIAAVVIGGASLAGGEGTVFGSLVGALLMEVIRMGFVHVGVHNWVQEMATGAIILFAAIADRLHRKAP